jgi:hypothetical protein
MAAPKRRAPRVPAATRARASGRNPATAVAAKDLAEAHRRAAAAATPIAKAATRRIVENKLALYSPEAAKEAAAMAGKAAKPASTPKRRRQPAKAAARKSARPRGGAR